MAALFAIVQVRSEVLEVGFGLELPGHDLLQILRVVEFGGIFFDQLSDIHHWLWLLLLLHLLLLLAPREDLFGDVQTRCTESDADVCVKRNLFHKINSYSVLNRN